MQKLSIVSLLIFGCATTLTKAQSFEHKTLVSGMGYFSKSSSVSANKNITFNNTSSFNNRNSYKTLNFELSAVYFVTSKIAIGASASLFNTSYTFFRQQSSGNITSVTIDSTISRETGGALRFDFLAVEKEKFSFGFKTTGGNYIVVTKSVSKNESFSPPNSATNTTEQTSKGSSLRFAIAPILYYKISKHILGQFSYASLFYRKTNSKIEPPAAENSSVETEYGANLNFSSLALGLSILF